MGWPRRWRRRARWGRAGAVPLRAGLLAHPPAPRPPRPSRRPPAPPAPQAKFLVLGPADVKEKQAAAIHAVVERLCVPATEAERILRHYRW